MRNLYVLAPLIFLTLALRAQACEPSGKQMGKRPPPRACNTSDADCCEPGNLYNTHTCSPPVTSRTHAILTLKNLEEGGDDGGKSKCDERYHSNNKPVVALSTSWFRVKHQKSCLDNIRISFKERSVDAMVVDECDSTRRMVIRSLAAITLLMVRVRSGRPWD